MKGIESEYRNNSIAENLRLWKEMLKGSEEVCVCLCACVRMLCVEWGVGYK